MQKKNIANIFRAPSPSDLIKFHVLLFFHENLRVNPIEKHVNSIFTGKICGDFVKVLAFRESTF